MAAVLVELVSPLLLVLSGVCVCVFVCVCVCVCGRGGWEGSETGAWADRQTDRQTRTQTDRHTHSRHTTDTQTHAHSKVPYMCPGLFLASAWYASSLSLSLSLHPHTLSACVYVCPYMCSLLHVFLTSTKCHGRHPHTLRVLTSMLICLLMCALTCVPYYMCSLRVSLHLC